MAGREPSLLTRPTLEQTQTTVAASASLPSKVSSHGCRVRQRTEALVQFIHLTELPLLPSQQLQSSIFDLIKHSIHDRKPTPIPGANSGTTLVMRGKDS
ncbi:hypothetical protein M758_5G075300 [Ceratodon purpureus]|nr:hypothetical protein M758_5G075300 [Ceratodon purpureus]